MADLGEPDRLKLFISYSRRDLAFADWLVAALKARGFEVRIDRQDLPKLEDWERELLDFIRQSDTVVFIASPHSLASKVVEWELAQVHLNGKRLAPVVSGTIEGIALPQEIAKINYVAFDDPALFDERADELARALNTDLAWVKEHTRLGELARRWLERSKPADALVRGEDLTDAESWAARRPREAPAVTAAQQAFLQASRAAEADRRRADQTQSRRRGQLRIALALLGVSALGYVAWSNRSYVAARFALLTDAIRPRALTAVQEGKLQARDGFKECSFCPEMVVVPAGKFMMGSPASEPGRRNEESPYHEVVIARPFAVSRLEVTFAQWDVCALVGDCAHQPADQGWGRASLPVTNVSWNDARQYAGWISRLTGQHYRLLSESEWEYAARGGSTSAYGWGNEIGRANANCKGCGSAWDNRQTAPVGSFSANAFGLHDMLGNVWEWVEDCWHDRYEGAPADGSAWTVACSDDGYRVVRGGGWNDDPADLRAAARYGGPVAIRNSVNGARLARTLIP
jgi:formylglycine-generating enzyme required for sulfatase activity